MLRDELVDDGPAGGQRGHRRLFVAVHQTAIALDIGGKDCRKASFERRSFHLTPLPFHKMTERHQWADAIADDLGDGKHRR